MAEIVLGLGTSHSPMLSMPPELWAEHGENDKIRTDLISPSDGKAHSYEDMLQQADPSISEHLTLDNFTAQFARCQRAIECLAQTLKDADPDIVVTIGDDQYELLFEDNMPTFMVYWGESIRLIPYERLLSAVTQTPSRAGRMAAWGYGDVEMDVPVASGLGRHLIEHLVESEFDVAHSRYLRQKYGGTVTIRYPSSQDGVELEDPRTYEERPCGLPHSCSFLVRRLMDNKPFKILPVLQNIYPPTTPTPKRSYDFGKAMQEAIQSWESDQRVAVIVSGGMSHFVVDEELDRSVLEALRKRDVDTLYSLPRHRLNSATAEVKGWLTLGASVDHLDMELIDYVPVYRTPAGTGGGWAFARWQ